MNDYVQPAPRGELPRREVMQTPDEVAAMLRLKALGWGVRRIAGELGCSHMTVRRYLAEGGDAGGHIVATGTPEDIASSAASYTGQYLRPYLARRVARRRRAG